MKLRTLGKTGYEVSEVGLGTWQVGGRWGTRFDRELSHSILKRAIDQGVNFIDTADVYSDGESERSVGEVVRAQKGRVYVATKCGRRISPHNEQEITADRLQASVEDSLRRLGLDQIDLIQLHCPPTAIYYRPEIFERFERLKEQGKIAHLGVSVEKVEEAQKAIEYDNVTTVQIIYNAFRLRPAERFFAEAKRRNVGIIVRVPLASGLLSGKFNRQTEFSREDHRYFNREGAGFDRGETFSGVPYEVGLRAVEKLRAFSGATRSLPQLALRFVLDSPEVSTVIPGASSPYQVSENLTASALVPLSSDEHLAIRNLYEQELRRYVHAYW